MIDLSVLILTMIAPMFHPTGKLATPIGTPANVGNTEVEIELLTEET